MFLAQETSIFLKTSKVMSMGFGFWVCFGLSRTPKHPGPESAHLYDNNKKKYNLGISLGPSECPRLFKNASSTFS